MGLPPTIYSTPSTPDLGCFVGTVHGFERDADFFMWLEHAPWEIVDDQLRFIPHQVYARIRCGEAAHHQRVRAWMAPYNTPGPALLGTPPHHVLGGDHPPRPSDWVKFAVQAGPMDYWFAGEHRPPAEAGWRRDASVGHAFDRYRNGTLSVVGWDDTGGDRDYDDLTLEVAVVYRRSYFLDIEPVRLNEREIERFERQALPRYHSSRQRAPARRAEG